jgi:poly-gamma-glutamate capsule biosynthesis protein CapA/YwtB (metallophosphatase superfamily)
MRPHCSYLTLLRDPLLSLNSMNSIYRPAFLLSATTLILVLTGFNLASAQTTSCISPVSATAMADSVRMVFGGDIVLGNSFIVEHIPKEWEENYFAGVRNILQRADIAIGNFEDTLTDHDKTSKTPGTGRQYAFRSPPHYAGLMYQEGFKVLNIANNHANDFGETGFKDTASNMRQAGIVVAGLKDEAAKVSVRGLNIAVLGFTYSSRFNTVFNLEEGAELVKQAKAAGAYVIVTFHAGAEGSPAIWHSNEDELFMGENRGNTVAFSRAMIDAGADLVVGHGPHVLRAAECYQGKPILYSLGNFVGVGGLSAKNFAAVSALLEVTVAQDGTLQNINLVPLRFNEQKLPQVDAREFGTRLVNHLGKHALYSASFIEFPVSNEGQAEFAAWLASNTPRASSAKK